MSVPAGGGRQAHRHNPMAAEVMSISGSAWIPGCPWEELLEFRKLFVPVLDWQPLALLFLCAAQIGVPSQGSAVFLCRFGAGAAVEGLCSHACMSDPTWDCGSEVQGRSESPPCLSSAPTCLGMRLSCLCGLCSGTPKFSAMHGPGDVW